MDRIFTLFFILIVSVGCGDPSQQRQAEQDAATAAELKALGEAQHAEQTEENETSN